MNPFDIEPKADMLTVDELMGADPLAGMEMTELEDGSLEFFVPESELGVEAAAFDANLADYMDEDALTELAKEQLEEFESDVNSRREWAEMFVAGLDVLGLKYERRSEPWEDACGVYSSVLVESAVRFQAEMMSETFPAAGPVKTKIIGEETPETKQAAERVREDMNHQLTDKMTEYRPEHERMLWALGLAGSSFKKIYKDPTRGRQVAMYLSAEDVIVPYGESTIEHTERATHIMRLTDNHIKKMQASGFYRDVEIGDAERFESDFLEIKEAKAEEDGYTLTDNADMRRAVLEMHVELVVEGLPESNDGIAKPYILTIDKTSSEVLGLKRNWRQGDPLFTKDQHLVHYCYIPGFGFYGLGLIHLVGGYSRAGTSIIRQLVDAGTLSNLPGGLKSRDLRNSENDTSPIGPGEWRDMNVPSGAIRDHVMPLPYKEPSQALLALLQVITEEGRRLGGVADMNVSDMSANAPVGTTLAILERMLLPIGAVQARIHYAMKQEFRLLKRLIAADAPRQYDYIPAGGESAVVARQNDYARVDVLPVSDPNASTMAQRIVQYQTALQMSAQAPHVYDLPMLHRQMLETIGIKNAEKIVAIPEDQTPRDPVSENMGVLTGKPLKAFIYQDHQAHITAHMAFLQDPMIAQTIGQSPMAQQAFAALQAHVAEHLGFAYRQQMQDMLGAPLPPPDEQLDEQIEVNLSRLVADGGKMLTQQHQAQAAQAEAQKQAEDPHLQIDRMAEETKRMEVERKARKDEQDAAIRKDEQQRKARADMVDGMLRKEEIAADRLDSQVSAAQTGIKLQNERKALDDRVNMDLLNAFLSSTQQQEKDSDNDGS